MSNILKSLIYIAIIPIITACKAETVDLSFMVYNYSTAGLGEVKINGEGNIIVDGAEKLGSVAGGGTSCCVSFDTKSETAEVSFFTDRGNGYKKYNIRVPIENLKDTPRSYAVLHYFPNNTGVIEISMRRPSFRKDLFDKALGSTQKNIKLSSPTMWNTLPENDAAKIQFAD
ncbi:hypothetical protein G9F32_15060 [Acinetobacter sp. 194]|uniref:hypothetical protein n=1 Tax=Acinetobacter shaoyimingii TaxID=2715164 RepID=UPI00140A8913|nr:hypothetical protein [Acinetobacter shaoyimingii]NHB59317.1 hypothetical protein [Acinetobacter shaoyimingii]